MSIKKPAGQCPIISMLRNLKVMLGQTDSNIMASSDLTQDGCTLTP